MSTYSVFLSMLSNISIFISQKWFSSSFFPPKCYTLLRIPSSMTVLPFLWGERWPNLQRLSEAASSPQLYLCCVFPVLLTVDLSKHILCIYVYFWSLLRSFLFTWRRGFLASFWYVWFTNVSPLAFGAIILWNKSCLNTYTAIPREPFW